MPLKQSFPPENKMLNVFTSNKNILKIFLILKLKNNVNFITSVRCLHKNGDSSEIDAFMGKYFEERKRIPFNIINRTHVFPLTMLPHLPPIEL